MHHNHLCQSFHDGTLTYAGLANQNGIVFLATA